ncbi:S-adenosyl-L-methionine dependent methyltransferase [Methylophaga frappieri]|uniref:S-adenosyl-L-methionine dependent methyltransferase n=1 Tax=Methylophaga frappieri (strain ATCC BAA-2434 / DSM 25690 / JAM7) TaxID=754477 RepID=I1YF20_METFJ|nr:cyclopropane-fatty-acyl-phospholipid synthase family protein [Methylophaga frappieri]AFJ01513.1 S-adenosyl-L-methionine dependent methyltransferase [Methylophaga frappieri]
MNRPLTSKDKATNTDWLTRFYQRLVHRQLSRIRHGCIYLHTTESAYQFGDSEADIKVTLTVYHPRFFRSLVQAGSIGVAESYMAGEWHCSDLTGLIRIMARNLDLSDAVEHGPARIAGWVLRAWHDRNRNNLRGSRKNIAAHYDLGNDLFSLFLDKDWMMYSSGLYLRNEDTLEQAQHQKLQRLCDKLDLQASDHLLEIGTGWGGCAIFAAKHYGCRVTTTTISQAQFDYVNARIKQAGLQNQVTVLMQDYRELTGEYDKLVSIEMVEAVGHHYLDDYFECCSALLATDGLAIIQAITIADHRYDQAVKSVDFIKRYIFPGSFIPSVCVLTESAAASRLRLINLEDIGPSYALTLAEWRHRFMSQLDTIRRQGYPDEFIRMWEFYLCYCEGGFAERTIGDVQLLFAKPDNRRSQWVA